jgi:phage tail-like protein
VTCVSETATFRLLDGYVGWDAEFVDHLFGLGDPDGIAVEPDAPAGAVPVDRLVRLFGVPRLARGCGPCEWYLVARGRADLLRRGPCADRFEPLWPAGCGYEVTRPVAVAARRHQVAVSDAGPIGESRGRVWVWSGGGRVFRGSVPFSRPGPLVFTASGQLLVAIAGTASVRRLTPSGDDLGVARIGARGEIVALAVARDCAIWAAVHRPDRSIRLYRARRPGAPFASASLGRAEADLPPSGVELVAAGGFCISHSGGSAAPSRRCYTWAGEPLESLAAPEGQALHARGTLVTRAIDSGIEGCCWHRVRADADVPSGTGVRISVAVSDGGPPHTADWQSGPQGALDFLVDQPPGRYLFVRLELSALAGQSPRVRRVRLDFPRVTSFDHLPGVYAETAEAQSFGERFMSLFDASIEELDRAIERHPALLDVRGVPDEALAWLGSFLDVAAEPWWGPDLYRRVLRAAPALYRRRGTPEALARAVELIFGTQPAITEAAPMRAWGAVGRTARLRSTRLFGRGRSRMRLGVSRLGTTPVRSLGNPDLDPLVGEAHRFSVLVPPGTVRQPGQLESLRRLVAAQAPAHAVGGVRVGGSGLVVGSWSAVGIDTALAPLPAPVLGSARLRRALVLWPGGGGPSGIASDHSSLVGVSTVTR